MAGPRYAGQYGPEGIEMAGNLPARNTEVAVYDTTGALALLYTDKSKSVFAPNPTKTDALGNLTFFAVPGSYGMMINGVLIGVMVNIHPEDPAIGEDLENPVVDWFRGDGEPIVVIGASIGDMYRDNLTGILYQLR